MTPQIAFLFVVLGAMVVLFLTEKLPVDLTACLGLVVLVATGYVEPVDAFRGFSSPAVITMLAIFIVSAGLLETGVADSIGARLHRWVGSREGPIIVTLMLVAGILSAFMPNIAATAVLMPAVASLGVLADIAPGRLFMPLSFGAILGGTTTLVGTAPNLLAGEILERHDGVGFDLFAFSPVGVLMLLVGVVFMATLGRRLLPDDDGADQRARPADLRRVYGLERRLFRLRIPRRSALDGATLGATRMGNALGIQVVSIRRSGRRIVSPGGDTVLRGDDELLVQGRRETLRELLRVRDLEVSDAESRQIALARDEVVAVRMAVPDGSPLVGQSLRDAAFRDRFDAVVVEVARGGERHHDHLAHQVLEAGDIVTGICLEDRVAGLHEHFEVLGIGEEVLAGLRDTSLFVLALPESSDLVGRTLGESRMGELTGFSVVGLVRDGDWLAVTPRVRLAAGDRLLVVGERSRIVGLEAVGDVEVDERVSQPELEDEEVHLVEAAVAPRSRLAGRTPVEIGFRERYGVQILGAWRAGERLFDDLGDLRLRVGDALLLLGDRSSASDLASDRDLVLLSGGRQPRRTDRAVFAVGALLLMVALVVSGLQPIQFAAFTAATLVVLSGALTMDEARRAIEWRAIFLVAAVLPVGAAMQSSGAAGFLSGSVIDLAGPHGPHAVLAALVVLSCLLSQGLDAAPAVVLLSPVVLEVAESLGYSPRAMMMAVALAASAAFMTPFSHKANLLVMGVGGYRSRDFLRVGTPLTVALLILLVVVVPLLLPLGGA